MYKRILSHHFIQDSVLFTVSGIVVSFLNYIFNLLVARTYSVSDYGEYATAISITTIITIPLGALALFIIKRIGQSAVSDRPALVFSLESKILSLLKHHRWLLLISCLALVIFLFIVPKLSYFSIIFIIVTICLVLLQNIYNPASQALRLFKFLAFLSIGQAIFKLLGISSLSYVTSFFPFIYILLIIAMGMSIFINRKYLLRDVNLDKNVSTSLPSAKKIFHNKSIQTSILATIGLVTLTNADIILAKTFLSAHDAGLYGALSLISKILFYAVSPLISVAYISFTNQDKHKEKNLIFLGVAGLIILGGTISTLCYYFLSNMIITLVFDQRYLEISPLLWQAGIFGTLYALITLFSQYFLAQGSYKSSLPLIGISIQIVLLMLFHNSVQTFMTINLLATTVLSSIYLLIWLKSSTKTIKNYA